jgi:hypothetical protein
MKRRTGRLGNEVPPPAPLENGNPKVVALAALKQTPNLVQNVAHAGAFGNAPVASRQQSSYPHGFLIRI